MVGRGSRSAGFLAARSSDDDGDKTAERRILVIEGRYYEDIADELAAGAAAVLDAAGYAHERITVPGALEIPQVLASAVQAGLIPQGGRRARFAGVVALGCVIRGETAHYDIVCNNANHWLMATAVANAIPVGNGILTVDTKEQALARARGGVDGKGGDAARACLALLTIAASFREGDA